MNRPNERFVTVRVPTQSGAAFSMTFLPASGSEPPAIEEHGVLAKIAASDPARAQRIVEGLKELIRRDGAFFTWLEASPQNSALFARDPAAAIRQALPDLPAGFFDGWRG